MTDPSNRQPHDDEVADDDARCRGDDGTGIEELRNLVVGPDRRRLEEVENRLTDPDRRAQDVSGVLPQAMRLRESDESFTEALSPSVEKVLRESVRRRPREIAEALYPVMGPAIRKSILDTLARFVQSLNQALEHSFSPRALKWRIEAWRTGKPFAEVVLIHTLLYRVEEVFLVHAETGLLLHHVCRSEGVADGDMVSGMMTAIQDFVRDGFGADAEDTLDTFRVGEFLVWVESIAPIAVAAVIRGTPPQDLRSELRAATEAIHVELGPELAEFDGDATPFERARPHLEACLREAGQERATARSRAPAIALAALLVAACGFWAWTSWQSSRRLAEFIERLENEPGIVVAGTEKDGGRTIVRGLADPAATSPASLVPESIDRDDLVLAFEPFHSAAPEIIRRRLHDALAPLPAGVDLGIDADRVRLAGRAPASWVRSARRRAETIAPGRVDLSQLRSETAAIEEVWREFTERLRREPGIVVVDFSTTPPLELRGLRDPLAANPRNLVPEALGATDVKLEFKPFTSNDAAITAERARQRLGPPPDVRLQVRDGVLSLAGQAPAAWVDRVRAIAPSIPGVTRIDASGLVAVDAEMIAAQKRCVEALRREPGIVVVSELRRDDGTVAVMLLRDPLARPAQDVIRTLEGRDTVVLDERPHVSLHPRLVAMRAERRLAPPPGVALSFEGGVLSITGSAPRRFITGLRERALTIPGVASVDLTALVDATAPLADATARFLDACERAPGIVVTRYDVGEESARVSGLRDPLGPTIAALASDAGLELDRLEAHFREFVSTDPPIVLERARRALLPPPGVQLDFSDGVLVARGAAPAAWIAKAERLGTFVAGVQSVRFDELGNTDARDFERTRRRLEARRIYFGPNATEPLPTSESETEGLCTDVARLRDLAKALGRRLRFSVTGATDGTGDPKLQDELARGRAEAIANRLRAAGIADELLEIRVTGADPSQPPALRRRVTVTVTESR